jgi:proton-dependent oligopeptide transporter, POT family
VDDSSEKKGSLAILKSMPRTYWIVIIMEFFERAAYYGMMAFLASYFVDHIGSHIQWGIMRPVLFWLLYIIPLFSGALAEKEGYKKILGIAFILMVIAYVGAGFATSYLVFFLFMVILGVGGGLFKPVISGTVARSTDERSSQLGFGVYYWTINVGSFLTSLVAAHYYEEDRFFILFMLAGVYVALLIPLNLLFYREPKKPGTIKTYGDAIKGIRTVCGNFPFLALLIIFSGFWVMYARSTDSALWLLKEDYLDLTPVNDFVSSALSPLFGLFGGEFRFSFNAANIMTINAGVIILFQIPVARLISKTRALPTMIVGIGLASTFPIIVACSSDVWMFVLGLLLFSIGEIIAYPKLISYVGLIAPKDKVAIYMGFVFLPVAISTAFDPINGLIWTRLVIEQGQVPTYWFIIAGIGVATMVGLIVYDRLLGKKLSLKE